MSPAEYLNEHQTNLGAHLQIQFICTDPSHVIGEMRAGPRHLTVGGRVHGGAIMAFADTVAAYGAVANLPSADHGTATLESKTNFFSTGEQGLLRAEARPIHLGKSTMVWETEVYSAGRRIALVLQTQIILNPHSAKN